MIVYCIDCGRTFPTQNIQVGICHEFDVVVDSVHEIDWCFFPMGYLVDEPVERPDWWMDEPSAEDMAISDINAEELSLELGLIG